MIVALFCAKYNENGNRITEINFQLSFRLRADRADINPAKALEKRRLLKVVLHFSEKDAARLLNLVPLRFFAERERADKGFMSALSPQR